MDPKSDSAKPGSDGDAFDTRQLCMLYKPDKYAHMPDPTNQTMTHIKVDNLDSDTRVSD